MNTRQARQIRGAIHAAQHDYAHVTEWIATHQTPLELTSLLHAHYRLVIKHYRTANKENK